jgi:hypothetical protein
MENETSRNVRRSFNRTNRAEKEKFGRNDNKQGCAW